MAAGTRPGAGPARSWTDAELLEGLQSLHREALREAPASLGKGSNAFAFIDCGLTPILDALRERVPRR